MLSRDGVFFAMVTHSDHAGLCSSDAIALLDALNSRPDETPDETPGQPWAPLRKMLVPVIVVALSFVALAIRSSSEADTPGELSDVPYAALAHPQVITITGDFTCLKDRVFDGPTTLQVDGNWVTVENCTWKAGAALAHAVKFTDTAHNCLFQNCSITSPWWHEQWARHQHQPSSSHPTHE